MAIEKVKDILELADKQKTSAIAFNCTDYNMLKPVIQVAEELRKPVIVMLYPEHAKDLEWTNLSTFVETTKSLAKNVKVPIGLHLDHCDDYDYIIQAIKAGFQSVMYDGSTLPMEENIANTREVVKVARPLGVDVEAELGHVGRPGGTENVKAEDTLTRPEDAVRFAEESGCTSLAVAVGTIHGFYEVEPVLDIERLKAINAVTDMPLVMHGGSGTPLDQLKIAFNEGINKFNVGTEFFHLYYETIRDYYKTQDGDFFKMPLLVQDKLSEYLREKLMITKITY